MLPIIWKNILINLTENIILAHFQIYLLYVMQHTLSVCDILFCYNNIENYIFVHD